MTGVSSPADLLTVVPVSSNAPPLVTANLNSTTPALAEQVQQVVKQTGVKNNTVGGSMCDEKTVEYLRDLIEEKKTIENNNNKDENAPKSIVLRLLDQGKLPSAFTKPLKNRAKNTKHDVIRISIIPFFIKIPCGFAAYFLIWTLFLKNKSI